MQYPMNVNLEGRRCIVLGGGAVALRKILTLLEAKAEVLLISPDAGEKLKSLALTGKIVWQKQCFHAGELPKGFLFICATNDEKVNRQAVKEAKEMGMLVNAPAQPELSDFTVPASLRRGRLLLTVSTEQLSPACAKWIRESLEREFPDSFADWLEFLADLRDDMKRQLPHSRERERFWREVLDEDILALVKQGELKQAEVKIRNAVGRYRTES